QMNERVYVVTYIEVDPSATTEAIDLLRQHAAVSRNDDGNLLYQPLQRIGRPNHLALIETWENADAQAAHAASGHIRRLRADLAPLLYSPYDERLHTNLHVADGTISAGSIFGLTHVDFAPTYLEEGLGHVAELVMSSRQHDGVVRFDVLTQANRRNHMTVVESWESAGAQEAHTVREDTIAFRNAAGPLMGALYDERLYRTL
ncbi:MAG TPA: antibiotic biosynthesis monooxygenase, partial [Gammaproteobacteria bacterium]